MSSTQISRNISCMLLFLLTAVMYNNKVQHEALAIVFYNIIAI